MKIIKFLFLLLYFAAFSYHCIASLQSAKQSSEVSKGVTEVIVEIKEEVFKQEVKDVEKLHYDVRKIIGHFAFFGLIGLFGFVAYYLFTESIKYSLVFTLLSGIVMSLTSELLQNFANERGPSIVDALIDYSGYLLASLVVFLIFFLIIKKKSMKIARANGAS